MSIKTKLEESLRDALRSNNEIQKRTIRLVLSSVKQEEIDKGVTLEDAGIMNVLQKEIKVRQESISGAEKANRPDMISTYRSEIAILETYLPTQMSEEEIASIASAVISEVQAAAPSDMGKVMKALLPRIQGRAPNDQVSRIVRQLLTAS